MLNDAAITRFRENLHGDFIQPSDPHYEEARKVFNGMIDKRPALIVRCAAIADVIAAVKLARENNMPLSVRGGGHGLIGTALRRRPCNRFVRNETRSRRPGQSDGTC